MTKNRSKIPLSAVTTSGTPEKRARTHSPVLEGHRNQPGQQGKPPLGIIPRFIVAEHRLFDIAQATARFAAAGRPIPIEWATEFLDLAEYLNSRPKPSGIPS